MTTKITSIEQFIEANFSEHSSDYIKLEAKMFNSFLIKILKAGWSLISVYNGEESIDIENEDRFMAMSDIFSVDTSILRIETADHQRVNLYINVGEGEAAPIYDHSDMSEENERFKDDAWSGAVKTHGGDKF